MDRRRFMVALASLPFGVIARDRVLNMLAIEPAVSAPAALTDNNLLTEYILRKFVPMLKRELIFTEFSRADVLMPGSVVRWSSGE